ncbi:MAG TPA: hypothetical protein VF602_05075 [Pedobacter sp.]
MKNKYRNYNIIIPVFFETLAPVCPTNYLNNYNLQLLTEFSERNQIRKIYLAKPIKLISSQTIVN